MLETLWNLCRTKKRNSEEVWRHAMEDLGRDICSFISCAAVCMFGSYSLYNEEILYAGGSGWDDGVKKNCVIFYAVLAKIKQGELAYDDG